MNAIKRLLAFLYGPIDRWLDRTLAEHIGEDEEEAARWQADK